MINMKIKGIKKYNKNEEKAKTIYNYEGVVFEIDDYKYFAFYDKNKDKITIIDVDNYTDTIDVEYKHWDYNLNKNGYDNYKIIKYIKDLRDIKITIEI